MAQVFREVIGSESLHTIFDISDFLGFLTCNPCSSTLILPESEDRHGALVYLSACPGWPEFIHHFGTTSFPEAKNSTSFLPPRCTTLQSNTWGGPIMDIYDHSLSSCFLQDLDLVFFAVQQP